MQTKPRRPGGIAGAAPTEQEARIAQLSLDGEGLAGALRVPLALPGERVRGLVEDGILTIEAVLDASPERVAPVCPHFGACGGCALQHASDRFIAGWKQTVVARALEARGLAAAIRPTATSAARSRRRATFAGRRTRKIVQVGFHARRSDRIVEITDCAVIRPELLAARPLLAELAGLGASRGGTIRLGATSGPAGLEIDVADAKPLDAGLAQALARNAERADLARLSWNGTPVALRRPPLQPMGCASVTPPPGAFLQATVEGQAALTEAVREAVGPARRIADLFAGCGTFALPLAEVAEIHAVEGDAAMLAALDAGWRGTPGLHRVNTERRDLYRRPLGAAELAGFASVVIDPPRAGAEAQARALAASAVARIAMVSCNPVSFARDAALLAAGGFRLDWVQVVDQFRWSGQVELAAAFSR